MGPTHFEQQGGVISGYSIEQLFLDLLVWLPGERHAENHYCPCCRSCAASQDVAVPDNPRLASNKHHHTRHGSAAALAKHRSHTQNLILQ